MALHQLSAQDAQFLYAQTPSSLTHVTGVSIYDPSTAPGGKVRFKDIIEHVRSRLHVSPVFKRKLYRLPFDMDHPYWVEEDHFDLEAHIAHARLPEPGDWRQFCIFISRLHSRTMDMTRPLWDMTVLEGLDGIADYAKGSYAVITRIHHTAIDGASANHFFAALSDRDAKGTPAIEVPDIPQDYGDVPSPAEIYTRTVTTNMTSPVKMANSTARFAPALFQAAQKRISGSDDKDRSTSMPITRFNGAVTPHKMFDAVVFPLDGLKSIKNKVEGATINDVVIAICGGALRKYLMKHKELPENSLIGWCPINLRRPGDGQEANPGNNISAMTVAIGTDIANPIKRLTAIRDITQKGKAGKAGLSARVMTDLTQHIPGATMAAVARLMTSERLAPKLANVFISNVPGPQFPLYMNGAKCTHTLGLAPLSNGMGLFIATPSYSGNMPFCIISDRNIMPDITFFRECIEKSYAELMDAKAPKPPTADKKAPAKPKPPLKRRVREINP